MVKIIYAHYYTCLHVVFATTAANAYCCQNQRHLKDLFDMANTFRTVTNTVAHGKLTYDSKQVYTVIKRKSVVHTVNVKIHFMKYIFYP